MDRLMEASVSRKSSSQNKIALSKNKIFHQKIPDSSKDSSSFSVSRVHTLSWVSVLLMIFDVGLFSGVTSYSTYHFVYWLTLYIGDITYGWLITIKVISYNWKTFLATRSRAWDTSDHYTAKRAAPDEDLEPMGWCQHRPMFPGTASELMPGWILHLTSVSPAPATGQLSMTWLYQVLLQLPSHCGIQPDIPSFLSYT